MASVPNLLQAHLAEKYQADAPVRDAAAKIAAGSRARAEHHNPAMRDKNHFTGQPMPKVTAAHRAKAHEAVRRARAARGMQMDGVTPL